MPPKRIANLVSTCRSGLRPKNWQDLSGMPLSWISPTPGTMVRWNRPKSEGTDNDHVARNRRPSPARGDARDSQAALALVSYTRRSDGPRWNASVDLSDCIIGRGCAFPWLAFDTRWRRSRHQFDRCEGRATLLASTGLGC